MLKKGEKITQLALPLCVCVCFFFVWMCVHIGCGRKSIEKSCNKPNELWFQPLFEDAKIASERGVYADVYVCDALRLRNIFVYY